MCEKLMAGFDLNTIESPGTYTLDLSEMPELEDMEYIDPKSSEWVKRLNTAMEATFEATCRFSKELLLLLSGVTYAVLSVCPNRKVAYLARYAKKKRTRKKNFNRAVRILEKEVRTNDL